MQLTKRLIYLNLLSITFMNLSIGIMKNKIITILVIVIIIAIGMLVGFLIVLKLAKYRKINDDSIKKSKDVNGKKTKKVVVKKYFR